MAKVSEQYSKQDAARRFEAALRGSRNVGPQPMKSMTPKRTKAQSGKRKKSKT